MGPCLAKKAPHYGSLPGQKGSALWVLALLQRHLILESLPEARVGQSLKASYSLF